MPSVGPNGIRPQTSATDPYSRARGRASTGVVVVVVTALSALLAAGFSPFWQEIPLDKISTMCYIVITMDVRRGTVLASVPDPKAKTSRHPHPAHDVFEKKEVNFFSQISVNKNLLKIKDFFAGRSKTCAKKTAESLAMLLKTNGSNKKTLDSLAMFMKIQALMFCFSRCI
jgi:hypothetical protein